MYVTKRPDTRAEYFLGLDLGQRRDRTAIAVIERAEIALAQRDPATWAPKRVVRTGVRHLQRLPLHTPYTTIAKHVSEMADKLSATGGCTLVVDATGVGLPIVDALRDSNSSWRLMPVTIAPVGREHYDDGFWRVPKRDLIACLQLAFENQAFRISRKLRECETLIAELTAMRSSTRPSGHVQYESPGAAHDDLAIALALAWWAAYTRRPANLGVNKPLL